jgi:uncharacterized protein YjiS (DUF1127 family)
MQQHAITTIDPSWAHRARMANGFGDAFVLEAAPAPAPGRSAEHDEAPSLRWMDVVANALRAFADAARAHAARRRQRRLARETFLVLNGLDGRTLRDLGFDRSEIASVACEVAGLADATRPHPERFPTGR